MNSEIRSHSSDPGQGEHDDRGQARPAARRGHRVPPGRTAFTYETPSQQVGGRPLRVAVQRPRDDREPDADDDQDDGRRDHRPRHGAVPGGVLVRPPAAWSCRAPPRGRRGRLGGGRPRSPARLRRDLLHGLDADGLELVGLGAQRAPEGAVPDLGHRVQGEQAGHHAAADQQVGEEAAVLHAGVEQPDLADEAREAAGCPARFMAGTKNSTPSTGEIAARPPSRVSDGAAGPDLDQARRPGRASSGW